MLLDTDILIDLLRGRKEARDFLYSLPEESLHCGSAITVAEIHSGMRAAEREKTAELLDSLVVLPVTKEIAETAGRFRREHKGGGVPAAAKRPARKTRSPESPEDAGFELELDDCLIAATAVVEGQELATRNRKHYPMPEVKVRPVVYKDSVQVALRDKSGDN